MASALPGTGRVAVVTGVARSNGIGRGCVRAFLQAGYRVVGCDVRELQAPGEDAVLSAAGDAFLFHTADVSSSDQLAALAAAAQERFGRAVHVLVNNAGIADPYLPHTESDSGGNGAGAAALAAKRVAMWRRVLDTNLSGAFLATEAFRPLLVPGDSSVIHVASTRVHQSEPHSEAYAAAKAGLIGLAHAQAASLAGRTRVNVISPGWIDTGDVAGADIRPEDAEWHWAGRVGTPSDIGEMALFLADGTRSGFITGQEFVVDGGVSRKMVYPDE